jgi:hypothetical protein
MEAMEELELGGRNLKAVNGLNVNWKSPFHAEPRHAKSGFYLLNENDA